MAPKETAGPELDALVAENVSVNAGRELDALIESHVFHRKPPTEHLGHECPLDEAMPTYSTDIAAAWPVFEEVLAVRGYCIGLGGDPQGWELFIAGIDGPDDFLVEGADTAPLAICLAALKALGLDLSV